MPATFRETAIKAAKKAGAIQERYYERSYSIKEKKDKSFATEADVQCSKAIKKIISSAFPDHDIIDEESKPTHKESDYRWIIDPIDGTHNFMVGSPLFGASIALQYRKEVILGVIYFPILKKLYIAEKGKGVSCNGKKISVNKNQDLKQSFFMFDSHIKRDTDLKLKLLKKIAARTWSVRLTGVCVFNLASIANGGIEFYIDFGIHSWDISAGALILEEAGGKVTDLEGNRWTPEIKDFVASNGAIHNRVLKLIKNSR
ncbi:MAG TPA: inositol monophosphatase [Candidatus Nanoarchaeia archaeon]|nr:inositol monophosphatase [Candidatus Nanoarchaeia archaeon]